MAPKVYVVIRGKDIEPGYYSSWNSFKSGVLNVKQDEGYDIEYEKFDGKGASERALVYWHRFYNQAPPHVKHAPTPAPSPGRGRQDRVKDEQGVWGPRTGRAKLQISKESYGESRNDWNGWRAQDYGSGNGLWTPTHGSWDEANNQRPRARAKSSPAPPSRDLARVSEFTSPDRASSTRAKPTTPAPPPTPPPAPAPAVREQTALEAYLLRRLQQLHSLRASVPQPPATDPVDRHDVSQSIVTAKWCTDNDVPVATTLLDGEIALALEVYTRVLNADSKTQDKALYTYLTIVDAKRDHNVRVSSGLVYSCIDKHAKLVRQREHDRVALEGLKVKLQDLNTENARLEAEATKKPASRRKVSTAEVSSQRLLALQDQIVLLERTNVKLQGEATQASKKSQALLQDKQYLLTQAQRGGRDVASTADLESELRACTAFKKRLESDAQAASKSLKSLKARNLELVTAKTTIELELRGVQASYAYKANEKNLLHRQLGKEEEKGAALTRKNDLLTAHIHELRAQVHEDDLAKFDELTHHGYADRDFREVDQLLRQAEFDSERRGPSPPPSPTPSTPDSEPTTEFEKAFEAGFEAGHLLPSPATTLTYSPPLSPTSSVSDVEDVTWTQGERAHLGNEGHKLRQELEKNKEGVHTSEDTTPTARDLRRASSARTVKAKRTAPNPSSSCKADLHSIDLSRDLVEFQPCPDCVAGSGKILHHRGKHRRKALPAGPPKN